VSQLVMSIAECELIILVPLVHMRRALVLGLLLCEKGQPPSPAQWCAKCLAGMGDL